jgi:predicted AlkP superfamily pyrophosphatase or phosphodiesterase
VTVGLAVEAAERLMLGHDGAPDLLLVSLSATDKIGHTFGPNSLERAASMAALDQRIGEVMEMVARLDAENVVVALTADHGVAPTVDEARRRQFDSDRVDDDELRAQLEQGLRHELGGSGHVAALRPPYVFLTGSASSRGRKGPLVARLLSEHPAVHSVWPTKELRSSSTNEIERLLKANSHPEVSGDVAFALRPFYASASDDLGALGAQHGSPWEFDRHVPVMVWGGGIDSRRIYEPVRVIDLTRTLGDLVGLPPHLAGGDSLP